MNDCLKISDVAALIALPLTKPFLQFLIDLSQWSLSRRCTFQRQLHYGGSVHHMHIIIHATEPLHRQLVFLEALG